MLRLLLERKIAVGLMVVLIFMVGVFSINKLDKELLPSIDFDLVMISVNAGNMPVSEVEERVTGPLEDMLDQTDGVKSFQSSSMVGSSSVFVEIEEGRLNDVKGLIEAGSSSLESQINGVNFIHVTPMSTDQGYEFFMEISGGSMEEMSEFARNVVEPRIESLSSVRDVQLSGLEEKEYIIEFDLEKLNDNGLDITQTAGLLQQSNLDTTLGELNAEEKNTSVRWDTAFSSAEQIEETKIPSAAGPVTLKDIAKINVETNQNSSAAWKDGSRDFIFVEIGRADGYTQLEMAEEIRMEVGDIKESGLNFSFNEIVNQADYVSSSLDGVSQNILIGSILALLTLIVFLRNLRATSIIGLSIPVSILLTFAVMWMFGYSLNMLTLIGLGLGIGMMVDASIVILESIYRKKEQGYTGTEAVTKGVKEVAGAVIASMLTTVVVFVPVGLFGGDFGVFILILSVVVVITLVSSVVVSFTLIPALSENFLKLRKKDRTLKKQGRITELYGSLISWLSGKKRRRYSLILMFFLVFGASVALTAKVPITLMPDVYDRYFETGVAFEDGLTPSEREEIVKAAHEKLSSIPDVETTIFIDDPQYLLTLVNMTKGDDITTPQEEVNTAINEALRELEEEYPVAGSGMIMGPMGGAPVQLMVKGDSLAEIEELSGKLTTELREVEGLVNVGTSVENTTEELQFVFDEKTLEEDGLTTMDIFGQLQGSFSPIPIGEAAVSDEIIPVMAKTNKVIDSEDALADFEVLSSAGLNPLSDYMSLERISMPVKIDRDNGERYVTVSGEIEGRDLGSVSRDVQSVLRNFDVPSGYTVAMAGDLEAQQEMIMDLLVVVGISIFLVYLVMAVQFNSLSHPIIVMSIIPMTLIGAILALLITQRELSVISALGVLMLIGIVLNNAILLIDRAKQLRKEGLNAAEAVKEAGKNRLRPIFMTTLTTVGGMLPLALATGSGSAYQAPLATIIIGGLLFATLITLVLIPSVYMLFEDIGNGVRKLFRRKDKKKDENVIDVA
ncbi:efflux RND transporter permease subunit [Evansella sp. LMS18]|uniref:efflux RND transporter permease subunit n=1 Tax=Evansella sp. LMS18 TaxID=2924033 RepID=UPI0020D11575|nr:efflux RND transporter permease subunit [Evansella sp. LMS18]UTR09094.1 efflux RND transporter permease subunit [Evansella sp. LMS18]